MSVRDKALRAAEAIAKYLPQGSTGAHVKSRVIDIIAAEFEGKTYRDGLLRAAEIARKESERAAAASESVYMSGYDAGCDYLAEQFEKEAHSER